MTRHSAEPVNDLTVFRRYLNVDEDMWVDESKISDSARDGNRTRQIVNDGGSVVGERREG